MEQQNYASLLVSFMVNTSIIAAVPLVVATGIGLIISIFQAVTQIQDQTLSQTAKIFAIGFVFLSFGGALIGPLMSLSAELFDNLNQIVQP